MLFLKRVHTHVMGRAQGPPKPACVPSTGRIVSTSGTKAMKRPASVTASAPPSLAPLTSSVTLPLCPVSLTQIGMSMVGNGSRYVSHQSSARSQRSLHPRGKVQLEHDGRVEVRGNQARDDEGVMLPSIGVRRSQHLEPRVERLRRQSGAAEETCIRRRSKVPIYFTLLAVEQRVVGARAVRARRRTRWWIS